MEFRPADLEFSPSAAEDVGLQFDGERLTLEVIDLEGDCVRQVFEALAFRWTPPADTGAPTEDGAYFVDDSPWIESVVAEDGQVRENLRHLVIGFPEQGRSLELVVHVANA